MVMRASLAMLSALLLVGCTQAPPPRAAESTPVRCTNARPASEFAHAGALPFELRSLELDCVLNATRMEPAHSRVYQLRNGRQLNLYEYLGQLPQKPAGAQLRESGEADVAGRRWQWSVLDHPQPVIVMSVQLPSAYIELSMPMRDQDSDLMLLRGLAGGVRIR